MFFILEKCVMQLDIISILTVLDFSLISLIIPSISWNIKGSPPVNIMRFA